MIFGVEYGVPFLYSTELAQLDKQLLWRSTVFVLAQAQYVFGPPSNLYRTPSIF
mgnify:CR=1 FL=1